MIFFCRSASKASVAPLPSKSPTVEWTDVPLQVPDVPDSVIKHMIADVPVPPPRKHRGKSPSLKNIADLGASSKEIKPPRALPQIPVEEPIIVPKKEPVHICDGTHHHVTNIANGKIIHDAHITPKRKTVVAKEILMQTNHGKPVRPKNTSTVSLPNYEELTVKSHRLKGTLQNPNPKKKPSRHISVTSLPTEGKTFLSATTAARLENYMLRCKSFGSLPPKQLLEKLQNEMDFASESDDSWEGLDDWDMEVLEHNAIRHSPVVPRSRLSAPTINASLGSAADRLPTTIEEVDEVLKNKVPLAQNKGIISLKKREGRRESIDDFFDSKAENPVARVVQIKKENFLGRRGSDGFFGYDKMYPLAHAENNNPNFTPDKFFSSSLLQSEAANTNMDINKLRRKSAGAALHRIESCEDDDENARIKSVIKTFDTEDDLLSTFQKFYKNDDKDVTPSVEEKNESEHKSEENHSEPKPELSFPIPTKVDWSQKFHKTDENEDYSSTEEKKQSDNESKDKKSKTESKINVPNVPKVDWTQKIRKDDDKSLNDKEVASMKSELNKQTEKISNEKKFGQVPFIGKPIIGETGKPSIVEHSNLLKFIQDNAIVQDDIPKIVADGCVVGGVNPEILRPALKDAEEKIKKIDDASKDSLKL